MRVRHPKSFLRLLAAGFLLVVLPLISTLATNAVSVDRLVNESENVVRAAVDLTEHTRALGEVVTSMERSARHMVVLGGPDLADGYASMHERFRQIVGQVLTLPLHRAQRQSLDAIVVEEQLLFNEFAGADRSLGAGRIADRFATLSELTDSLMAHSGRQIDREIVSLHQLAEQTQKIVVWQMMAIIPLVLVTVGGFLILLSRPIEQLDHAIRKLGDGELRSEIEVGGTRDLQYLGQQLNWLRLRLLEVDEQKSRFLRHVSHDLKTPLTALWDGASLLAEDIVGTLNSRQREIVAILKESSLQLRSHIEDLLNHTAAASEIDVRFAPVPLRETVRTVVEHQKLAIVGKNLTLRLDFDEITVEGHEEKLRVLVDNLLSNAIKFSPPSGTVEVRLKQTANSAVLIIRDQGPGIPEAESTRVFDAFYQGSQAVSGAIRGSGLGLAIAREHVLAHCGRIEILQFAPQSAHVRVILPLRASTKTA